MRLEHDTQLTLSIGNSRKSLSWSQTVMPLSSLYGRLSNPIRGTETMAAYLALPKRRQDELKDVGGFVGGTLDGVRRLGNKVIDRCLVTLDFDTMPPYSVDSTLQKVEAIGFSFCCYSTRKHRKEAPRLRIVFPLNRKVTPDEYDAIARKMASAIGIEMADPTTFEPHRLMYWPSCCSDGEFIFRFKDAPLADADLILGLYADWHNWEDRPRVPGENSKYKQLAVKQGNPTEKSGVVGAFCRVYNIYSAMDKFLPGIYEPCGNHGDRFTYLNGSTAGGAVVYQDGLFLYSHHATDPCCDRLVNAFDLVRLHLYGDLDNDKDPGTQITRMPSYAKMCETAMADPEVLLLMNQERTANAATEFGDLRRSEQDSAPAEPETPDAPEDESWKLELARNVKTGAVKPTIENVLTILEHDSLLRGRFALNKFAGRGEVLGRLPWMEAAERRMWSDTDSNGMYWYLERVYDLTGRGAIDSALDLHATKHAFNEVQDYIDGLVWDGTPRLDTVFTDYLGADDTPYTRAVCRKAFAAAVARVMSPGCKYDQMVILCGPQGIGKSTLLFKMAHGWFNDSIRTFEGKEASELLQGVWLVEIAELDAFRRSDVSRIKQFLSLRADRYRAAYAHNAREFPRRCVFFGTSNQSDFLQDTTGNRRFWPIDVGLVPHTLNPFEDLTENVIDQIWAEAKMRWTIGEPLYLTDDTIEEARRQQEDHRDASSQEGLIADFVDKEIPADWDHWSVEQRRAFWSGGGAGDVPLVPRQKITAIEIWCELFMRGQADIKRNDSREINAIIASMPDWRKISGTFRCGPYGIQRGFYRYKGV